MEEFRHRQSQHRWVADTELQRFGGGGTADTKTTAAAKSYGAPYEIEALAPAWGGRQDKIDDFDGPNIMSRATIVSHTPVS